MPLHDFEDLQPGRPPGLKLAYDVMTPREEAELIELVERSGLTYPAYDAGNTRSSRSYGMEYNFLEDSFVACPPMPEGLLPICRKAASFASVELEDVVACLLNRYEPGAVIQWHFDKPVWEHVIGVSLGTPVDMLFRKEIGEGYEFATVPLPPRSMYLLAADSRHLFEHSLPPTEGTRWSITFRTISREARRRGGHSAGIV
jgi:DNA oxidative demethylase